MDIQGCIFLLPYMVAIATSGSWAFNIDSDNPRIYTGQEKDFFGYKVLQFMSGNKTGILVTAPLQENGTGGICRCVQNECTECYTPPVPAKAISLKNFGFSISEDSTHPNQFTSCSPSLAHECYDNTYLNSVCYHFKDQLQPISTQRPAFQDCTEKSVNLVFLFDGSASMTDNEFEKNKYFIEDIMTSLKSSSIKFAAVQFSTFTRKVFDFNDYQNGTASVLLQKEKHMKGLTNTYEALKYVLKNIFELQAVGASPDATKVLVIITDGKPSDKITNICEDYDKKNIIRFVIGVKYVSLDELYAVASEPKQNNTFHIQNYNGLSGILQNFEKKIFNIEGANKALAGNLADEMSQSGFSAAYYKNTLVLGSVGSNDWRGALHELRLDSVERKIQDPKMMKSSYMGYSVAAGQKNSVALYFTGAPRFEHTGQVVLFKQVHNNWTVAQRVNGSQIGSYFGAELCTVDVDSDNNIDFLLVGAPLFHQPREKREGLVYVYTVTNELELKSEMSVSVPSRGRFGTIISSLSDLNGDLFRDVAIGAPLEDDNRGAVYIYLGDKSEGIRRNYSQRITAEKINTQLQFFGQAIDGRIDLNEDGLPDIVVGSHGRAVVLWSKPVISVSAHLSFEPSEISTVNINCLGNTDAILPMITFTACFDVAELTHSKDALVTGLNITYNVDVDPIRQNSRGFFNGTENRARSFQSTVELKYKTCFKHSINMAKCVKDTLSPVMIRLEFSQHQSEKATAILNVDSIKHAVIEAPFEKTCRKTDSCIAELEVDFNFTTKTLLVAHQNDFTVILRFSNTGDDSYNTSLTLQYPPGLSFSTLHLMEATRATLHSCNDLEGILDKTVCGVSLPVYRSSTSATFKALFRIIDTYEWNETMSMTITAKSDNENSTRGSMTKSIPVQFQIDLAVSVNEDTVAYFNFTPEDSGSKRLVNIYEVKNLGFKPVPIDVSIIIPTKLKHNFEMKNYQVSVQGNKTQCVDTNSVTSVYCSADKYCKLIVCEGFILNRHSTTQFILSGDVAFMNLEQHVKDMALINRFTGDGAEVLFKSLIKVRYDKKRYFQESSTFENEDHFKDFPQAQTDVRVELIISPEKKLIYGIGVGVGLILLFIVIVIMFKMGCFKSKTAQDYQDENKENYLALAEQASEPPVTPSAINKSDYQSHPEGPTEGKPILSNGGEDDNSISTVNT